MGSTRRQAGRKWAGIGKEAAGSAPVAHREVAGRLGGKEERSNLERKMGAAAGRTLGGEGSGWKRREGEDREDVGREEVIGWTWEGRSKSDGGDGGQDKGGWVKIRER